MAHLILFEHVNLHGNHKHLFRTDTDLGSGGDNFMNNKTSSFVILEGHWEFFSEPGFVAKFGSTLGPGVYTSTNALGMGANDKISSVRSV